MSRRFIYFAVAGLVLGGAVVALPYVMEGAVQAELRQRLEARGVEASWTQLDWRWPASVALDDVEFSARGGRIDGRAERVEISLPFDAAFADKPHADAVEVHGATVLVDLKRAAAEASPQKTRASLPAGALFDRLEQLGRASGDDVDVTVVRGTDPVAKLHVARFEVAEAGDGQRSMRARGELTVQHPKMRFLPLSTFGWRADGAIIAAQKRVEMQVRADDDEKPLVSLAAPKLGMFSVERVDLSAELGQQRSVGATVRDLRAKLGELDRPAVELSVSGLSAHKAKGRSLEVLASQPHLAVAPRKLGRLFGRVRHLLDDGRAAGGADPASGSSQPSRAGLAARLSWWLNRLDAVVEDGRFELRLSDKAGAARRITLVDKLQANLQAGHLDARGASAGGEFGLSATLEPGMLLPRTLTAHATDVRLDELPGVKEGRTLPNRGLRGRVGGVVDLSVVLSTTGEPLLRPASRGQVDLAASVHWKNGRVELSGLADQPLEQIDAGADFDLSWTPAMGHIALHHARATYGPVAVTVRGALDDWPFDPVVDLRADVDEIACQQAVRALPKALLGAYDHVEIDGKAAPQLSFHMPWHRPKKLQIHLDGFVDQCHVTALNADKAAWPEVSFAQESSPQRSQRAQRKKAPEKFAAPAQALAKDTSVSSVSSVVNPTTTEPNWPTPEKLRAETFELPEPPDDDASKTLDDVFWLNRPFKMQVTEGVSEDAQVVVGPGTDTYVPLEELAPFVGGAAYLSEEMGFYEDHGVDLGLIQKALRIDFEGERFVYGGSTVTQQLVKNLFLTRDKTLSRKLREALIAWRIEDVVPKWRVLELYINCIEYAQDVYGVGPAAEHYFGKDARDLTPKEAVFIAILKPAPWYGDRFRRRGHSPTEHWWFDRMGEIMGRLVDKGYLTPEQAEAEKPYVLYWDDEGNYLPDGPPSDGPPSDGPPSEDTPE